MKKVYVLDTNVILCSPKAIFSFKDSEIVIPMIVVEEVDRFKKNMDNIGYAAREFSRAIDSLRKRGNLFSGVETREGGIIKIVNIDNSILCNYNLDLTNNDNIIISTALYLKKESTKKEIILISRDTNVRLKADYHGLSTDTYKEDGVDFKTLPKGYEVIYTSGENIDKFFSKKLVSSNDFKLMLELEHLYPNSFYLLKDQLSEQHQAIVRFDPFDEVMRPLSKIKNVSGISPRNLEQKMALELLLDERIKLICLIGGAGTGKTLLALASAIQQTIEDGIYNKLLVARPVINFGNQELGFLPGTLEEKMRPWVQPIMDNLEYILTDVDRMNIFEKHGPIKSIDDIFENKIIEVEALTYIRGRSIPNSLMILDEAQNLTANELKTIISRAGENTKIILTGDVMQIDNKYLTESTSGITYVAEKLKECNITARVVLEKCERSELAEIAAKYL